jgi:NADPH:quinone reductase-like Zn-dependent oxidoreductase
LLICNQGSYPHPIRDGVVPGSDGAGTVEATGSKVARFKAGDRVVTLYNQGHIYGRLTPSAAATGLGGSKDGCFRQYGVFDENGLVAMPKNLNFQEAATLSCAALTAWNGLYGLQGRTIMPGDVVLTQGTGGVSLFALQVSI